MGKVQVNDGGCVGDQRRVGAGCGGGQGWWCVLSIGGA